MLDENVKKELLKFLNSKRYDSISKPKGLLNGELAEFSKLEKRILVTNDEDFIGFSKERIFSAVLLKLPQDKPESLLDTFSKLLKEIKPEDFEGKLIILKEGKFEVFPMLSSTPV